MTTKKKLGQILLAAGVIDEYQLKSALGFQKKWGGRLGNVLVENRFITEDVLVQAIREQTGIDAIQLSGRSIPDYLLKLVPQELAEKHHLIPISLEGEAGKPSETLIVATSDPTNLTALDELRFKTGKRIQPILAGEKDLERAIAVHYRGEAADGLDFDIDPEGIQFGGPEMEAGSLDSELVVVQGTLESGPADQGGADPAGAGPAGAGDPFAELASLGAPPPAEAVPAPAAPPAAMVDDPFAELDALVGPVDQVAATDPGGGAHPAATDLDFDLDAPDQGAAEQEPEILEDIEIIDDVEQIDPAPAPVAAPADADPSPFGEPDSDLAALGGQLEAMPDLDQPADLSGVPDLEPADPTPVMPAPGPPATQGLEKLPDLEPAGSDEPLPTVQGQQVAPSPFAEEESSDESTADLLLDGDDLDLDAVLAPISNQEPGEAEGQPAPDVSGSGQPTALPDAGDPEAAERPKPDSVPTQIIPAGVERPKPDSVPTQVLSLADMQPAPEEQVAPPATPEPAQAGAAPAPASPEAAQEPGAPGGETEGPAGDQAAPAATRAEPENEADPEEKVKSDAMKALLSRVGLSKDQPAGAAGTKKARPSDPESRTAAGPAGGDPTLAALIRLMIKKGLFTAEELEGELDGD